MGDITPLYSENGRPGIETHFTIGLLPLKHRARSPDKIATTTTEDEQM